LVGKGAGALSIFVVFAVRNASKNLSTGGQKLIHISASLVGAEDGAGRVFKGFRADAQLEKKEDRH
jgi:hypothetical protein